MRRFILSLVALVGLSTAAALGNYAVTQGAGTTFGSVTVGGIHYAQQFICDLTTPAQCATVSAAGAVKVDGSAVTQPVSGTVTANQGGTWTVQPGNTANTTPWLVTGSGTAGSAATGVLTVQGIASMTPFLTNPGTAANWGIGTSTQNSATVANGQLALAQFNTTPTTITNGNMSPLQMDNSGKLLVNCTGCSASSAVTVSSSTAPVSTMNSASANSGVNTPIAGVFDDTSPTAITENNFGFLRMSANRNAYTTLRDAAGNERGANVDSSNRLTVSDTTAQASLATIATNSAGANPVNVNGVVTAQTGLTPGVSQTGTIIAANIDLSSVLGTATAVNSGNLSAGVQRTTLATNSVAIPTWGHGATGAAVPSGATYLGINSGGNLTGWNGAVTQSGTWTVQPGNTANTTPWLTTPAAGTANGATPYTLVAAATNNSTNVKSSAGTVYAIQTGNVNASTPYYLKLYDKATAPTCGTDTPVAVYLIPPANSGNNINTTVGKAFTLGIGFCLVTGIANNDNTSVPASTIVLNIDYK